MSREYVDWNTLHDYDWNKRPRYAIKDGKKLKCLYRCTKSWLGGGTCPCRKHDPEIWVGVGEGEE